ncbi:MAG: hypothetical protein HPY66_0294 [Firmicutes bacterium]|nr:hypothetical protein [Bacillota bacterium]
MLYYFWKVHTCRSRSGSNPTPAVIVVCFDGIIIHAVWEI